MRSRKTALQSRKEKADRFKTGSRRAVRKREQIGRSSREIRVPAVRMTAATESRVRAVRPEIAKMITEKPEQGRSAAIIPKRRGEKTAAAAAEITARGTAARRGEARVPIAAIRIKRTAEIKSSI